MSDLTIYKASAGSGKTFKLTEQYLIMLIKQPSAYKHILAVTFTNKATGEMKNRIVNELNLLSKGENSKHLKTLREILKLSQLQIEERATSALRYILHDYSRFSVSTIDHFFQRVIRTFAREMGLQSGYTLETDETEILNYVIDQLLLSTEEDEALKNWLVEFASSRMLEGKSWNFRDAIMDLAGELSKEHVKDLSSDFIENVQDKEKLSRYLKFLQREKSSFEKKLQKVGEKGVRQMEDQQLQRADFFQGNRGPANYFYQLASLSKFEPNSYVRKILDEPEKLAANKADPETKQKVQSITGDFLRLLKEATDFYDEKVSFYQSVRKIYDNVFVLGILMDIQKRIDAYCREKNLFLISDASELLRRIIDNNEAPFIYEKSGNYFRHFMIDEFQDTSRFQWDNFSPLVQNSLAQDGKNLLVGDVKQSIYRWRNSDWKILSDEVHHTYREYHPDIKQLDFNYRSTEWVVAFFNTVFSYLPAILQNQFNGNMDDTGLNNPWKEKLIRAYSDVRQAMPFQKNGGYVYHEFLKHTTEQKSSIRKDIREKVIRDVERLQDKGYDLSDIAIIVRKNSEGQEIANALLEKKNNGENHSYKYDVISNDSLYISKAESIRFILALFRFFTSPEDMINRAFILETYRRKILRQEYADHQLSELFEGYMDEQFFSFLPEEFGKDQAELKKMPLYELTERLIHLFRIQYLEGEVAYLEAFQNMVMDFSRRNAADVNTFVEWWEEKGKREKLQLPENYNAIQVVTIHKAKGLEFRAVILPFCNWELDETSTGVKRNYLWPHPEDEKLGELEYVPVDYSKSLKETIFAKDFFTEQFHNYVDNLNLLYVAFTRAEEALICYSPIMQSKDGKMNYEKNNQLKTVADLMYFLMENHSGLSFQPSDDKPFIGQMHRYWNSDQLYFEGGELKKKGGEESDEGLQLHLKHYPVYGKTPPLRLSFEHGMYFRERPDLFETRVDYGNVMHQVFEYIHVPQDIPGALEKVYLEGKIDRKEQQALKEQIQKLVDEEDVKKFFDPSWRILTEQEILLPNGNTYRPDRVMMKSGQTLVLDYKFGEKMEKKHEKQMKGYLKRIKEMGYQEIQGYIWYVSQHKIKEVKLEK